MRRGWRRECGLWDAAAVLWSAVVIAGCNNVLGIREALPEDWDGAPYVADAAGPAASLPEGSMDEAGGGSSSALAEAGSSSGGVPAEPLLDAAAVWAQWPMPNPPSLMDLPNPQKYDTSMPGIVIDRVTHLQWQAAPAGAGTPAAMPWSAAAAYCTGLPTAGGGWRLPSRIELMSIVDYTQPAPTLDSTSFAGSPSGAYWTASPLAGSVSAYWVIDFSGSPNLIISTPTTMSDGGTVLYYARCVR